MYHLERKVSGVAGFMRKKGPAAGNTSMAFYASYVFFEKMRIRDGKPKPSTDWEWRMRGMASSSLEVEARYGYQEGP